MIELAPLTHNLTTVYTESTTTRVTSTALVTPIAPVSLIDLALSGVTSPHTKRAYGAALQKYIASGRALCRSGVMAWLTELQSNGLGSVGLNIHLAAVRKLTYEAYQHGAIDTQEYAAIQSIRTQKRTGARLGHWTDIAGIKRLLKAQETQDNRMYASRNQAILAVLLGCGLRRAELVSLDWTQWRYIDNRYLWADIKGKGNKLRTVPVPSWTAAYVHEYNEGKTTGRVFSIGVSWVYEIVLDACRLAGIPLLRPHDLRRSYSRLSRDGGAPLEQISQTLGHASLTTTQLYLGNNLALAPGLGCGDYIQYEKD